MRYDNHEVFLFLRCYCGCQNFLGFYSLFFKALNVCLQEYERMNLADALVSKKFKDGECVIQQVRCLEMLKVFVSLRMLKNNVPCSSRHLTSSGGWH